MPWTTKQKAVAVQACRAAGISEESRKLILRQFPRSMFDRSGGPTGEPSSTSKRLTNSDLEQFMAVVERTAGGRIAGYSAGYWDRKAADDLERMRRLVVQIDQALRLHMPEGQWSDYSLPGWIRKRVKREDGRPVDTDRLEELTFNELYQLIEGLKAFCFRWSIKWRTS